MAAFEQHLQKIVGRVNSLTGLAYRDDPTIMAWQLANEPRGVFRPRAFRRWIKRAATLIRSIDPNHLLSIGSEGNTAGPTGNHFRKDHAPDLVDYTTIHIWVQNWGWYDPQRPEATYDHAVEKAKKYLQKHLAGAEKLKKPLVLEEFGIARDLDDHHPDASTKWRDRYYREIFQQIHEFAEAKTSIAGCNFWAWAGEGRPGAPKAVWQSGDPFTGDPPHEYQGWYSVYDRDTATLRVIREFGERMPAIGRK